MSKTLGKITRAHFGIGGYQDVMFGFSFSFDSSEGWSIGDWRGSWNNNPDKSAKWTASERDAILCKHFLEIRDIMNQAKVDSFSDLVGKPVELTTDTEHGWGGQLVSWRILTEVL